MIEVHKETWAGLIPVLNPVWHAANLSTEFNEGRFLQSPGSKAQSTPYCQGVLNPYHSAPGAVGGCPSRAKQHSAARVCGLRGSCCAACAGLPCTQAGGGGSRDVYGARRSGLSAAGWPAAARAGPQRRRCVREACFTGVAHIPVHAPMLGPKLSKCLFNDELLTVHCFNNLRQKKYCIVNQLRDTLCAERRSQC